MKPEDYEAWYESPRGRWIGAVELALLRSMLRAQPGDSLLDVGCGTGHFTREFARDLGPVVGLDPDEDWLSFAATRAAHGERYVAGRAESLPFPDRSFECTVSVTALCFVRRQEQALRELIRVTRRRFVLGLLNRHSLLYLRKGRGVGVGAYRGAHWHTPKEIRSLLAPLPVANPRLRAAIVLPGGGVIARAIERVWPPGLPLGGFIAVAGEVIGGAQRAATSGISPAGRRRQDDDP